MAGDANDGPAWGVAGASDCHQAGRSERRCTPPARPGARFRPRPRCWSWAAGRRGSRRPCTPRSPGRGRCSSTSRPGPGGRSGGEPPRGARAWLARLERSGAEVLARATVVDAPKPGELLVEHEGGRSARATSGWSSRPGRASFFLPFPGWTLPGVVGAGGAQALLKAGARVRGLRVVVAGLGPAAPRGGRRAAAGGARVVGVVEQAPLARVAAFGAALWRQPRKLAEGLGCAAALLGAPLPGGSVGPRGGGRRAVEGVLVTDGRGEWRWACDVLACGFGLVPSLELPRLLGCETADGAVVLDAEQRTSVPGVFAAGELGGHRRARPRPSRPAPRRPRRRGPARPRGVRSRRPER
jgi:D-hydroxyproline dehydrogenase subunit alpha